MFVFWFSGFVGMKIFFWAMKSSFVSGKELLDEKWVQIVCDGWVGMVGREEILWSGVRENGILFPLGLADSSGGVRGKALWGNFEAKNKLFLINY